MKKLAAALAMAGLMSYGGAANAVITCGIGAGNLGIQSVNCNLVGTTLTIDEVWNAVGIGSVVIDGLDPGVDYTVIKNVTNNTGVNWIRLATELLDPAGQAEDAGDPQPYPSFVPAGFTTSNDNDGLSFAQGSLIPRTSTVFAGVLSDELTDARDFIDFFNGLLATGGVGSFSFGLRENFGTQQPFLLMQRPNTSSREIPEPGTLALLGLAVAGLAFCRRKTTNA